jgi:hypothetical protein
VAIALPKYGPASFFQQTGGRRTPEERARNWSRSVSIGVKGIGHVAPSDQCVAERY